MKPIVLVAALAAVVTASAAQAQSADTILVNGKVITLDGRSSVAQGDRHPRRQGARRPAATRTSASAPTRTPRWSTSAAAPSSPGSMDSHIHALRAGLTYLDRS